MKEARWLHKICVKLNPDKQIKCMFLSEKMNKKEEEYRPKIPVLFLLITQDLLIILG